MSDGGADAGVDAGCVLRPMDDYADTQACALDLGTPPVSRSVQRNGLNEHDWMRFDPIADHIYWTHCGSDDPLCWVQVRTADAGLIATSQTWPSLNDRAWGHVHFTAPANTPTLWFDITPEGSTALTFNLEDVGPDDFTVATQLDAGTVHTAWLQTRTDEDEFLVALDAGVHTLSFTQRPNYSGFVLNEAGPPGMGLAQGGPTNMPASSHNFFLGVAGNVRLRVRVQSPSDMPGQGRVDFKIQ